MDEITVEDLLAQLGHDDWTVRQAAATALGDRRLAGDAPELDRVVTALLESAVGESDGDVAGAAAAGLVRLREGGANAVADLVRIARETPHGEALDVAFNALGGQPDSPFGAADWLTLIRRVTPTGTLVSFFSTHVPPEDAVDQLMKWLKDADAWRLEARIEAARQLALIGQSKLSAESSREVVDLLVKLAGDEGYVGAACAISFLEFTDGSGDSYVDHLRRLATCPHQEVADNALERLVQQTPSEQENRLIEELLHERHLSPGLLRLAADRLPEDQFRYELAKTLQSEVVTDRRIYVVAPFIKPGILVEQLPSLLSHQDAGVRFAAASVVGDKGKNELTKDAKEALWRTAKTDDFVEVRASAIGALIAAGEALLTNEQLTEEARARVALTEGRGQQAFDLLWRTDPDTAVDLVLAGLEIEDQEVRNAVVSQLKKVVGRIPESRLIQLGTSLRLLTKQELGDSSEQLNEVLAQLQSRIDSRKKALQIARTGSTDDERKQGVDRLIDSRSADSVRAVVRLWTTWIAEMNSPLVEHVGSRIAVIPEAVSPLVEELKATYDRNWNPEASSKATPYDDEGSTIHLRAELHRAVDQELTEDGLVGADDLQISLFLQRKRRDNDEWREFLERSDMPASPTRDRLLDEVVQWRMNDRRRITRRRIAAELATMSEASGDDISRNDEITQALNRFAIPEASRLIPTEKDVEVRESLACILAWQRTRESISALARAVVGDERTRMERQALLARYYLEPSRQQSDQAAEILDTAVKDARKTLVTLRWLNIALFVVALGLLVFGVVGGVLVQDGESRIASVFAAVVGGAGVLVQLVREPLDRIQNSLSNLVQIETAFTSFIWELNLNGTYIQSQYVAEGVLADIEVQRTVDRIEGAMEHAIHLVAAYTVAGRPQISSRVHSVAPGAAEPGARMTVTGEHLAGPHGNGGPQPGMIAIDHEPIDLDGTTWKDTEVTFTLPSSLSANGVDEVHWVSLFVDGVETNAVPVTLLAARSTS